MYKNTILAIVEGKSSFYLLKSVMGIYIPWMKVFRSGLEYQYDNFVYTLIYSIQEIFKEKISSLFFFIT